MNPEIFIAYDSWANERIYLEIREIESGDLKNQVCRLFGHLLSAQIVWCQRVKGEEITQDIWPDASLNDNEMMMRDTPAMLSEMISEPEKIINYQNSKGDEFQNTVEEIITHLTIHGQHHRAQIALLLRQAGINPPATDLIFYLRQHN